MFAPPDLRIMHLRVVLSFMVASIGCSSEYVHEPSEPDVRQVGEFEYRVTRTRLDAGLVWLSRNNCAFVPVEKAGRVVGLRVYGIKSGSLPSQLGVRNGDTLLEVDGIPLSDAQRAWRARTEYRRKSDVSVKMERAGRPLTLVYRILAAPTMLEEDIDE